MSLEATVLLTGLTFLLFSWLPGPPFRLEQFDLPKDLALGAFGCIAAFLLLDGDIPWDASLDAPIASCLCWGIILTFAVGTNVDVGLHTLGISCGASALFVFARRVGARNPAAAPYFAISIILFVFAVLVLLEAFGGIPLISSPGRRPGATVGNRNLAARVACLSLPLLWHQIQVAYRTVNRRFLLLMVTSAVAVVVISRSRAAMLTTGGLSIAMPALAMWRSDSLIASRARCTLRSWALAVVVGGMLAILLPNRLGWGASDFASSARRAFEYQSGSGRGRLIQLETTWRMIRANPLRGVGPGNWSIVYPAYAPLEDPSVRLGSFYPAPQVPRNDILSFVAEFGIPGFFLALVSIVALFARSIVMLRNANVLTQQSGLLVVGLLVATVLLGLFDSVVRVTPTVSLIALVTGLAIGKDAVANGRSSTRRRAVFAARRAIVLCYACGAFVLARAALHEVEALRILESPETVDDLYRAVSIAPNNVEARMLLSYVLVGAKRCDLAEPHLTRASLLQPFSLAVRTLRKQCEPAPR